MTQSSKLINSWYQTLHEMDLKKLSVKLIIAHDHWIKIIFTPIWKEAINGTCITENSFSIYCKCFPLVWLNYISQEYNFTMYKFDNLNKANNKETKWFWMSCDLIVTFGFEKNQTCDSGYVMLSSLDEFIKTILLYRRKQYRRFWVRKKYPVRQTSLSQRCRVKSMISR